MVRTLLYANFVIENAVIPGSQKIKSEFVELIPNIKVQKKATLMKPLMVFLLVFEKKIEEKSGYLNAPNKKSMMS
tara:strand:+ start:115 stop:339 length:225 start_codon:yes stop_codon:yes gene_type:complete